MKKKLIPLGLIVLYIAIYFVILLPYDQLWFYMLPTYKLGDSNILMANVVLEILLVLLYSFIVFKIKKISPLKLWNHAGIRVKAGIAAFFTGVASALYTVCFFKLPYTLDHFPMYNNLLVQFFGQGAFIVFVMFCITSTAFKEVMFRGLIFNELRNTFPVAVAVILQAAIYGTANFYSQGVEAVVFASFGAIIFALLYLWTKSIWTSVIAQLGCSSTICTLTMLKDSVINRTTSVYIVGPSVLAVLVLVFYFWNSRKKTAKVAETKELNAAM